MTHSCTGKPEVGRCNSGEVQEQIAENLGIMANDDHTGSLHLKAVPVLRAAKSMSWRHSAIEDIRTLLRQLSRIQYNQTNLRVDTRD